MSLSRDDISEEYRSEINLFDCGKETVNAFLKEDAIELHNHNNCITQLVFSDEHLVGFISLRVGEIEIEKSLIHSNGWLNRLPKTHAVKPRYPVIKVQYLGVDSRYKRRGIARYLLLDVFENAYKVVETMGCNFIYLESYITEEALGLYKSFDFVEIDRDEELKIANMFFKIERI